MNGLTAAITGGARGIGASVAREFVSAGANVVLGGRDADALEAVVAEFPDDRVTALRTDVRDEYDVERLMETAARFGAEGIDVVVATAAVYHGTPGETPLGAESYAAFDDTYRTNARGVFATVREALPHLSDDARVLVPSESVGREGKPGYGAYAVSKAAAEAVMRGFAADTPYAVGCLDPGTVATEPAGGQGRDPNTVAELFRWAATEVAPADLNGAVLTVEDWKESE